MNIEIKVTGGTVRNAKAKIIINGNQSGDIEMDRAFFSKFCDLLFVGGYTISSNSVCKTTTENENKL